MSLGVESETVWSVPTYKVSTLWVFNPAIDIRPFPANSTDSHVSHLPPLLSISSTENARSLPVR
jgi:hypothetical protein